MGFGISFYEAAACADCGDDSGYGVCEARVFS